MKLIFQTETEVLKEIDTLQMTDEIESELETSFDNRTILKYEITFKEGVLVKDCHALEDIDHKIASVLKITVA